MAASLITAPLLLYFMGTDPATEWLRLSIMALVTTGVAIGITFVTPRTREEVLLAFYERVQPFGWWRVTARTAGDRPDAPLDRLKRRAWAIFYTAASLFLLLLGVGRLMIMPPGASLLWTWAYIGLGLALVPLWWRALLQEDLEVDRSLRPEDVQVTDGVLLAERDGLLLALRQLAQHRRIVYGMEVAVEPRGVYRGGGAAHPAVRGPGAAPVSRRPRPPRQGHHHRRSRRRLPCGRDRAGGRRHRFRPGAGAGARGAAARLPRARARR